MSLAGLNFLLEIEIKGYLIKEIKKKRVINLTKLSNSFYANTFLFLHLVLSNNVGGVYVWPCWVKSIVSN
jgi:hypothetical protein